MCHVLHSCTCFAIPLPAAISFSFNGSLNAPPPGGIGLPHQTPCQCENFFPLAASARCPAENHPVHPLGPHLKPLSPNRNHPAKPKPPPAPEDNVESSPLPLK